MRKNEASAPKTLPLGADALHQTSVATVAFRLTAEQAAKIGMLEDWQKVSNRRFSRLAKKRHQEEELKGLVAQFSTLTAAMTERKMQEKTGLHRRCWRRIRAGELTGREAIRKLEAALQRLKAS